MYLHVFFTFPSGSSPGYWSDEGCTVNDDDSDSDTTVCECDHLTDFAVLMKPSKPKVTAQMVFDTVYNLSSFSLFQHGNR